MKRGENQMIFLFHIINNKDKIFILINENEAVIRKLESIAANSINEKLKDPCANFNDIKSQITSDLFNYVYETTGRKPIILPIILDVKRVQ